MKDLQVLDPLNALVELWRREEVGVGQGNSSKVIQEFEVRNSVVFPTEFRNYLFLCDGMYPDASRDTDRRGFCFWPLHNIKPAFTEFERGQAHETRNLDPALKKYFIFADYLQWSWAYAINLTTDGGNGTIVRVEEPGRVVVVSQSFFEFIRLYIEDSKYIYKS